MNTIKILFMRFKWYILLTSIMILALIVRAIGSSSKQAHYEKVIKDVVEKKRDELFAREKSISDSIVSEEQKTIEQKEAQIVEIKKDLEKRSSSGRNFDSRKTNARLKEMGLK